MTEPEFTLEDLNNNFSIVTARFELYPIDNPTSYAVGFGISHKTNKKNYYADTQIPLADISGKTDVDIVHLAWDNVKTNVLIWCKSVMNTSSIHNSIFVPNTL
jgi:hypothetical protein